VTAAGESPPPPLRERYRTQVRHEVKQAALAQLAQAGPAAVSISAIGKQLGVSGPALYRYFASRDDLLTELTIDAYRDLAAALTAASRPADAAASRPADAAASRPADAASRPEGQASPTRLEAAARAYRSWALAQPHRYRLLFGPPLPGYDAHAQPLVEAAQASMNVLLEVLGELGDRPSGPLPEPLASQLAAWSRDLAVSPDTARRAIVAWSRLHGLVSLEIAGNFASMSLDPGQLFEVQLASLST
jgi:AcrR family transcriptional regulator